MTERVLTVLLGFAIGSALVSLTALAYLLAHR